MHEATSHNIVKQENRAHQAAPESPNAGGPDEIPPPTPHPQTPTTRITLATHRHAPIPPTKDTAEQQLVPYDTPQHHLTRYTGYNFYGPITRMGHSPRTKHHPWTTTTLTPQRHNPIPQSQKHHASIPRNCREHNPPSTYYTFHITTPDHHTISPIYIDPNNTHTHTHTPLHTLHIQPCTEQGTPPP